MQPAALKAATPQPGRKRLRGIARSSGFVAPGAKLGGASSKFSAIWRKTILLDAISSAKNPSDHSEAT
jgi:hypothetical protein